MRSVETRPVSLKNAFETTAFIQNTVESRGILVKTVEGKQIFDDAVKSLAGWWQEETF